MNSKHEYELGYCPTAQELLDTPFNYDILFLDIMLDNGNDGIEIAKKLRAAENKALFVLTTSRKDRALDGYGATVFRYLVKPVIYEEFATVLSDGMRLLEDYRRVYKIRFKYQTAYVPIRDIIYVESYMRRRFIVTKERGYPTTTPWSELEEQFSAFPNFFSPRKTHIINLAHVTEQSHVGVTVSNNVRLKFAAGMYEQFLSAFSKFINERL
jgi:DNA-binding LytR/AlgR family response regulator